MAAQKIELLRRKVNFVYAPNTSKAYKNKLLVSAIGSEKNRVGRSGKHFILFFC